MTTLVANAINDKSRPRRDFARDARDSTAQVLAFTGVKPGDVVLDFLPFRGYFTRLFSSIVGENGHVYASVPQALTAIGRIAKGAEEIKAFANTRNNVTLIQGRPELIGEPPVAVDLVFIAQNYHDLHDRFMGPVDIAMLNRSVFRSLKPGGICVIIDHTAQHDSPRDVTETLHRIDPAVVREEIEAAGLECVGRSAMLANPDDPRTGSIFGRTIRYRTDRFILKFRRPAEPCP